MGLLGKRQAADEEGGKTPSQQQYYWDTAGVKGSESEVSRVKGGHPQGD